MPELRKPLRFTIDDLVLYRGPGGWFEGKIVDLWAREDDWAESTPSSPYKIQGLTKDHLAYAQEEHVIRMPPDLTPDANGRIIPPEVKDPKANLYCVDHEGMSDQDKRIVRDHLRRMLKTTINWEEKQEARQGVDGYIVLQVAQVVVARRHYQDYSTDLVSAFDSIVPPEDSLEELENNLDRVDKILQLADALMFGLKGWPRDPNRAFMLYHAAAYHCPESKVEEYCEADGYPVGLPEACCAVAQSFHNHCMMTAFGNRDEGPDTIASVIKCAKRNREVMRGLRLLIKWYNHAIQQGHVCPNALRYAQVLAKLPPSQRHLMGNVTPLLKALEYRRIEQELEQQMAIPMQDAMNRANPSPLTLKLFQFQACKIFSSLPTNNRISGIHLEYRQVHLPSFPILLIALNRNTGQLFKAWRLPGMLQLTPFSIESLEYAWLHVAYEFHLGISTGKQHKRCRPMLITIPDDEGHGNLAEFFRLQLVDGATRVQVVQGGSDLLKNGECVEDAMCATELGLVSDIPKLLQLQEVRPRTLSTSSSGNDQQENQILTDAAKLKEHGNNHFAAGRFIPARCCYTNGIHLLDAMATSSSTVESYKLLGTMMSNRAQCSLELVDKLNPDVSLFTMHKTVMDCNNALQSHWKDSIPENIQVKLSKRKEMAMSKIKTLKKKLSQGKRKEPQKPVVRDHLLILGQKVPVAHNHIVCPMCCKRFQHELKYSYCTELACGHYFCLSCLSLWERRSWHMKKLDCPLCRIVDNTNLLQILAHQLLGTDKLLRKAMDDLPLDDEKSLRVYSTLLENALFNPCKIQLGLEKLILSTLEPMLWKLGYDHNSNEWKTFLQAKQTIMGAVDTLEEYSIKVEELNNPETTDWDVMHTELELLRQQCSECRQEALESTLKTVAAKNADLAVDFTNISYEVARIRFDSLVCVLLPALESILCKTGPGVMVQILQKHAEHHESIRWASIEGQQDFFRVMWVQVDVEEEESENDDDTPEGIDPIESSSDDKK